MAQSVWEKVITYGFEILGRFYSTYRGYVVDNEDPKRLNRVKVIFPSIIPNDDIGVWAFPKGNWGGKDYGTSLLPEKGDMIFLEFDHGDLDYPIWSHAGYGTDEKPKEFDKYNDYGLKTPNGNIILIEDGTNKEDGKILVQFKTLKEYYKIQKDLFELEALQIKLGKKGDEWAVMGETLKAKLTTILQKLESLETQLATHTHTTNSGPSGPPIEATAFEEIKSDFAIIRNELPEILSAKVKIDK